MATDESNGRDGREPIQTEVVVAGGGLAGLTCAVALSRAGVDCILVERDVRLGGRARSWRDEETGDPIHIGPHVFLSVYPNAFKLLDWLGTREKIVWQDDHFITVADGESTFVMHQDPLPPPLHFAPSVASDDRVGFLDKLSVLPVLLYAMQLDEEDVMELDDVTAYTFLRGMGVTEAYTRQFWAFASRAIMNVPLEICSAGALMRFFKRFIGHNEVYFGFPDGGLGDLFAPQAREFIDDHGNEVWLESEIDEFVERNGRVEGVLLADGRRIEAEETVAALPPQTLRALIPREWMKRHQMFSALSYFEPSPYISPYIWFDHKLTDMMMWARQFRPHDLNCEFYDMSNIVEGWEERPSFITSNIIYAHRADGLSDDEIIEATVDEISDFLPRASMDRVEHARVNRIPMAIHCPHPGTEKRRPPTRSPIPGLLLAGDWIQTRLPASMESAVKAGWMAADRLVEVRGRSAEFAVPHPPVEGITGLVDRAKRLIS